MDDGARAVRDIVRSVVDAEARHERGYLERLERFDDPWVVWRLQHERRRDEPLGFGIGEIATLITPVIWVAIYEMAKEVGSTTGDGISGAVRALLRRVLRRKPQPAIIPPLTEDQRKKVHATVLNTLVQKKLSKSRAEAIADAVYRELSVEPVSAGNAEPDPGPAAD
jgi:hypothetical protein